MGTSLALTTSPNDSLDASKDPKPLPTAGLRTKPSHAGSQIFVRPDDSATLSSVSRAWIGLWGTNGTSRVLSNSQALAVFPRPLNRKAPITMAPAASDSAAPREKVSSTQMEQMVIEAKTGQPGLRS